HPLLECDLEIARHQLRRAAVVGREIRRKIIEDLVLLSRAAGKIDHVAGQLLPVLARIAGAVLNQLERMARRADALDELFTLTVGQRGSALLLARSGKGNERESSGDQGGTGGPGHCMAFE